MQNELYGWGNAGSGRLSKEEYKSFFPHPVEMYKEHFESEYIKKMGIKMLKHPIN